MMQIVGISAVSLLLALFLKEVYPSFSVILVICAAGLLFIKMSGSLSSIISYLNDISGSAGEANSYVKLMVKTLGIALVSQLMADICRDNGESALAGQTETAAKILIIAMIMPLFEAVVKAVSGILI